MSTIIPCSTLTALVDMIERGDMFFTENFFARVWPKQANRVDEVLHPIKKELFVHVRGTVVEIGPGTGVNFQYFPQDISWNGVEPNRTLRLALMKHSSLPKRWQVYDHISAVRDGFADTVVSTIVLCSVPDLPLFLHDVLRILKPGGIFLSLEHVGAPRGTLHRMLQACIKPISRRIGGGCKPNRDIEEAIRHAGFSKVDCLFSGNVAITRLPFVKVPIVALKAVK